MSTKIKKDKDRKYGGIGVLERGSGVIFVKHREYIEMPRTTISQQHSIME